MTYAAIEAEILDALRGALEALQMKFSEEQASTAGVDEDPADQAYAMNVTTEMRSLLNGVSGKPVSRQVLLYREALALFRDFMALEVGDAVDVEGRDLRRLVDGALGASEPLPSPVSTPWGAPQHTEFLARGVFSVITAGHGGIKVADAFNQRIPEYLRNEDGWYEEDCDWCLVALAFPDLFSDADVESAKKTLADYYPNAFEAHFGYRPTAEQSHVVAREEFDRQHRDHWQIYSARGEGRFVLGHGRVGGREGHGPERLFIVPRDEYRRREAGMNFVIDDDRHGPVPVGDVYTGDFSALLPLQSGQQVEGRVLLMGGSAVIEGTGAERFYLAPLCEQALLFVGQHVSLSVDSDGKVQWPQAWVLTMEQDGDTLFWGNRRGWTPCLEDARACASSEKAAGNLPEVGPEACRWISLDEARDFGQTTEPSFSPSA